VSYGLIIESAVSEAIATMPEIPHALFVLACLDIGGNPHGRGGVTDKTSGSITTRTWAVGPWGLIEYEIDDENRVVTLTGVISML
jgi:hypothetical protein